MSDESQPCDAAALLSALQLGDSFFPSGLYTLSHGLESFVQSGRVRTAAELQALLVDYVTRVAGSADAVAAAEATRASAAGDLETIVAVDWHLYAMKLAHEAALASSRTGKRLVALGRGLSEEPSLHRYAAAVGEGRSPGNYAVALGVLGAAWGLTPEHAALVDLYSLVTGLLGAGLRTVRLDHAQAQSVLHALKPLLAETAREAARTGYQDMRASAPLVDIMQMQHERARVRLFAS